MQASFSPLIALAINIAIFAVFVYLAWALNDPNQGGGRVRGLGGVIVAYTVGWLGPLWTGVVGGVIAIIIVAWMVLRIADPPIEVKLVPEASGSRRRR